jgi:hypothetical protein
MGFAGLKKSFRGPHLARGRINVVHVWFRFRRMKEYSTTTNLNTYTTILLIGGTVTIN